MTQIHHLNCGILHKPPQPEAICHCLLLEDAQGLALVDTGIGLLEVQNPLERVGQEMIDAVGFQFHEELTAIRQIEQMGFQAEDVKHIILSHLDNDHAGGLADFPQAQVHVSAEEWKAFQQASFRYFPQQVAHEPDFVFYASSEATWFGLEARPVNIPFATDIYLVPLFGHTLGHCGVAIQQGEQWLWYVGDAYFLRVELEDDQHPVAQFAISMAEDNSQRVQSLHQIKALKSNYAQQIEIFAYHDPTEFPSKSFSNS